MSLVKNLPTQWWETDKENRTGRINWWKTSRIQLGNVGRKPKDRIIDEKIFQPWPKTEKEKPNYHVDIADKKIDEKPLNLIGTDEENRS